MLSACSVNVSRTLVRKGDADLGTVHRRSHFVGRTTVCGKLDHVVVHTAKVPSSVICEVSTVLELEAEDVLRLSTNPVP